MKKSTSLVLTLVAALLPVSASAADKPNIVIILADDLGYGDVRAYNADSKIDTANIDQLAAGGMRFTDAHAGGSVCVPSRYSLFTGRFAARAEMNAGAGPVISEGRATTASMLRDHGYSTRMVGKWHLGFETLPGKENDFDYEKPLRGGPIDRGFDSFFGMHASLDIPPYFYMRDRNPVLPPTDTVGARSSVGDPDGWNQIQGAFWRTGPVAPDFKHEEVTPRFADEAVKVIESYGAQAAGSDRAKPLFLYVALPAPHTPWLPLQQFRGKSGAGMYGDYVLQVDAVVGQITRALNHAGIADDTLVIFSSDNGPVWYEENVERFGHDSVGGLRGIKGQSWEGGHRMPFVMRWPARIAAGSVSEQTIAFCDVFATLAELVGAREFPEGTAEDSQSFLPWLLDASKAPEARAPIVQDDKTLRDGDWKLILPRNVRALGGGGKAAKSGGELYNLRDDLAEQHNQFDAQPEKAEQMMATLKAILAK